MARRAGILVAAVAGLAVALALAGVAAAATTPAPSGPGSPAFRSCLQKHGVTLTRPAGAKPPQNGTRPGGGRPPLTAKQRAAFKACGATRPARAGAGTKTTNLLKKYTQCLSQHGVTFGKTSSSSTKFKAADKACRKYLP